jgi:hypothetical protein
MQTTKWENTFTMQIADLYLEYMNDNVIFGRNFNIANIQIFKYF